MEFRQKISKIPFASFSGFIENISNLEKLPLSKEQKKEQLEKIVSSAEENLSRMSPRVADLFEAMILIFSF